MSLKAFHIVFIVISVALTAGFGVWALKTDPGYPGWGKACLVVSVCLVVYGVAFLKKLQREHL
jgi:hypothetical protein